MNPLADFSQIRETMRECAARPRDGPFPRPDDGSLARPRDGPLSRYDRD